MTGYTVHTGASKKFVAGWDKIFAGDQPNDSQASKSKKRKPPAKKKKKKKS